MAQRDHGRFDAGGVDSDAVASHIVSERERALLARARAGDLDAFAEFVRLSERRVRALLGRFLDDERDVDEAAQDTFVQAWRNLERFRGDAAPFTWLYRIAVNEALQRTRRKTVPTVPFEDTPEHEPTVTAREAVDEQAASRETLAFLGRRLRALPVEARTPLVLRDLEGWSYEAIANALDLTVPAVKSRVHRARMQLDGELRAWRREGDP
jgi:RNA polymerase sigma-70 factor (ECF subfamily)